MGSYLAAVEVPLALRMEAPLVLQLLLDRFFKCLIHIQAVESNPNVPALVSDGLNGEP